MRLAAGLMCPSHRQFPPMRPRAMIRGQGTSLAAAFTEPYFTAKSVSGLRPRRSCRAAGRIAMMTPRSFPPGRWLMALAIAGALCATAIAAPPQHKGTPAAAHKKDAPKKDEPNVTAPHAILIDAEYGGVLFERDADRLIFPASLAKLMTAEYVFHEIKEGRIKLTDEYMVSENAWRKGGAPSHGSTMFAALYSKVSVDDLLHGMIIQSANDACIVLAEGIAGNSF